jgi:hypothetical protein
MMYDTIMWNWLKFALCDDVIFIASCINYAFVYEIWGLMPKEKNLTSICNYKTYCVVLGSWMTLWSRSKNYGIMKHIGPSLMVGRIFMQWTTWSIFTIMGCSCT